MSVRQERKTEDGRRHDPWQERSIPFPRHIETPTETKEETTFLGR
jgi:hypothetical protein